MPMETIAELEHLKPSELLTTGQMIDLLKVGEVAEVVSGGVNKGYKLYINERGDFVSIGDNTTCAVMNKGCINAKWRILPRFVSFEEARKAFDQGKTIWCEYRGKKEWYSGVLCHEQKEASPSWGEIRFGKWSIDI
jgi:hypothetical protein